MYRNRDWITFVVLLFLTIISRIPSFDEPIDTDSGAVAYHARQIIRGEPLYGTHHPLHHLPGVYYTFAFAFKVFGDSQVSPKIFLGFWIFACAVLLFTLGRSFFNHQTGILASLIYIIISSQIQFQGTTVEMEQFANLPLTAGTLLAIFLLHKNAEPWLFIWVGILGAICILFKAIFITPLGIAGLCILIVPFLKKDNTNAWSVATQRLLWLVIGLALPLVFVAGYFASLGLLGRLLLALKLGFSYVQNNTFGIFEMGWYPPPFGFPFVWISRNNTTLFILGLVGMYRCLRQSIPIRNMNMLKDFSLALWLIISFIEAGIRGGGYEHYVLLAIPPLSLLAAAQIDKIYQHFHENMRFNKYAGTIRIILILLLAANFIIMNSSFYGKYLLYKSGSISYTDFIRGYEGTSGTGPNSLAAIDIANYVRSHTLPDEFIYVVSGHMQIYYFADRKPPVESVWPFYFASSETTSDQIFNPKTKYIVVDPALKTFLEVNYALDRDYFLETSIDGIEIYRHR